MLLQATLYRLSAPPKEHQSASGATTYALVSWLQPSHWEVESEFARHCRSRAEGTFEWIFKVAEFKEWRLGSSSRQGSRSLWLNGLPANPRLRRTLYRLYKPIILKLRYCISSANLETPTWARCRSSCGPSQRSWSRKSLLLDPTCRI